MLFKLVSNSWIKQLHYFSLPWPQAHVTVPNRWFEFFLNKCLIFKLLRIHCAEIHFLIILLHSNCGQIFFLKVTYYSLIDTPVLKRLNEFFKSNYIDTTNAWFFISDAY